MANVRKRILELTPLPSASLDTTIVGVDNGTTYRIELDVLADAVTSRVNILDRDRLSSLESVTSSFETKGRSVISSSAQITSFGFISSSVTIPTGTISSSAQITSFGFISQSVDITSLNSFTSSQQTLNTAFTNGISARLQTSSFNDFSTSVDSRIIAATNEQSLTHLVTTSSFNEYTASQSTSSLVNRLTAIESISGSWITESETGSFLTSLNGAISSSTQISDLGFVTGSYTTINSFNSLTQSFNSISQSFNVISGSVGEIDFSGINSVTASYLAFTQSYTTDSSSFDSRITTEKNRIDAILSASNANGDTFAEVVSLINSVDLTNDNAFATFYTASNGRLTSLESSTGSYLTSLSGAISSSSQLTSSYDTRYVISGSVGATPLGTISGSSQLTSSYDTRYALSASFVSSSNVASIQTITSASYAALTPVSGTLYIIIG